MYFRKRTTLQTLQIRITMKRNILLLIILTVISLEASGQKYTIYVDDFNSEIEIGIRYQESYPYRDIWLEVSHNTKDTLTYVTDTLQLFLVDEAGNKTGNGLCGLYQCDLPYKASIPIRTEGSARTFRIVHIMTDNPLTGISDIGIRLRKPENQ